MTINLEPDIQVGTLASECLRARVELEAALARQAGELERLHAMLDLQTQLICRVRVDGTVTYANETSAHYYGRQLREMVGDSFLKHLAPPARALVSALLASLGPRSPETVFEHPYVDRAGQTRWLQWTLRYLGPASDSPARQAEEGEILAVGQDVTDRKRADLDLQSSQDRLKLALEAAHAGAWAWESTANQVYWSEENFRLLGYAPGEVAPGLEAWQRALHPEERERALALMQQAAQDQRGLDFEVRVVWPDGTLHWLRNVGRAVWDEGSRRTRIVGLQIDITSDKERDRALAQSEQYLRRIIDSSLDMIITTDNERRIVEFNPAAEKAFGYTRAEVLGRHVGLLYADAQQSESSHRQSLNEATGAREVLNRRRNGEIFTSLLSTAVMRGPTGEPLGIVGVSRDITDRKRAEAEIRQLNAELEQRVAARTAELQRYAEEQAALYHTALQLNTHLELEDLLRVLAEQVAALLNAQAGIVFLYDRETAELCCRVGVGFAQEFVGLRLKPGEGAAGRAFVTRRPQAVSDDAAWSWASPTMEQDLRMKSVLAVPLLGAHEVLGVLVLAYDEAGRKIDLHDLHLAELLAAQSAIALENAQLFRGEKEQRELAETLHVIGGLLTESLDPDHLLDRIMEAVGLLVPHDAANLMLLQDDELRVVRARGYERLGAPDPSHLVFMPESSPFFASVLARGQSLVVSDTQRTPEWQARPEMAWVRSFACAPIRFRNETIGLLNVDSLTPGLYAARHAARLQGLANQVAIALSNARMYEKERIAAERLQALAHHLVQAQEQERARISRELHDEVGQLLTAQTVELHLLEQDAAAPDQVLARAGALKRSTQELLESLRRITADLRPAVLDYLGLIPALEQYAARVQQQHPELSLQFQTLGLGPARLPGLVETALYRLTQESLTNIVRHAHARRAEIVLQKREGQLVLRVWDDGIGFEPQQALRSGRLGLAGMRERAAMLGGAFWIESRPGHGTTIHVEVPLEDTHPDRG